MSKQTRELGVLIIGAGDMGERHARHWQEAGARVVAVCDPLLARAEASAATVGAQAFAAADEALSREDVQVVSVCTPTYLHAPYTLQALAAGKHVLCEKPAALTLKDAERMKAAAEGHGLELRIGFMRRFDPAFDQLREWHAKIGTPTLAQATIVAGIRPKRLMHDARANGGPIIDMCCHIFNVWSALFGEEAEEVNAHGYTFAEGKPEVADIEHKALDSVQFTLLYSGGSVGQVQVSWGLPSGVAYLERHSYVGPDGLLVVNWNSDMTLHVGAEPLRWHTDGRDPWRAEIRQFYLELTEGAERQVAGIDRGIAALRTSLAVLHSVARQQPVRVAEVADGLPDLGTGALP